MDVVDVLRDAETAVREYAVCLSYDRSAAVDRGDPDAAAALRDRFTVAHRLADELHAVNPSTVAAGRLELAFVRALAAELVHRLGDLEPEIRRDRRTPRTELSAVRGIIVSVARAVAYLRVSTDRQAESGFGLDVQEAAVRTWARRNKVRVVAVIRDEGRSGAADVIDRPGLAEALSVVQSGRADALVVPRLDRLARDLVLQEWIRAELVNAGGQLRSSDAVEDLHLVEDPDNPTGTLVRQILGAVAQYERAMIRLRMHAGRERKRLAGGYAGGQPPYGYRADAGELVADLEEQRQVQRMRRWRRAGKSYRQIANRLNEERIPARGGGRWHPPTVSRVLARAARRQSEAS